MKPVLSRFFSERSFTLQLKVTVFFVTIFLALIVGLSIKLSFFEPAQARLVLYVFYVLIFINTFFCGFGPGIVMASLSSMLAVIVLIPQGFNFHQFSLTELEVFPFVALYYLVAITVDWFREHIEKLQVQLEENERLHEQAKHMEKLALAGEIAAGIAHEIRNPLTVVQGYIQLLASKNKGQKEDVSYTLLLDELKRANQIISDFLRFSRPGNPQKEIVQLNEVIEATSALIFGEAKRRKIELISSLDPNLPEILLDRGQLLQVFLNLFTNALHAMPNGGTLTVHSVYNADQHHVCIEVCDTGMGIALEALPRVFTPFYTTKENGTGLGLSLSQNIVLAHGGQIKVESVLGQGTDFIIFFDLTADSH